MKTIWLPGQTPSSKNSRKPFANKGKIVLSDFYVGWRDEACLRLRGHELIGYPWQYPVLVVFHFYRSSKHLFDHVNLTQGPLDVLVKVGILQADDMNHVVTGIPSWSLDKNNPGALLAIYEANESVTFKWGPTDD